VQVIPFEIHITVEAIAGEAMDAFERWCTRAGGKALLIELSRGACIQQPMFGRVVHHHSLAQALAAARDYANQMQEAGFVAKRLKIEVPCENASLPGITADNGFAPYFEWHGKLVYENTAALENICEAHKAHLSANALKGEAATRFVTLREYASAQVFAARVESLIMALHSGGWQIRKQESEYCVYDNNLQLDKGWLEERN
jgi:hypothetical protein